MASTLADLARQRRNDLKRLMVLSRNLDASQEALEREIKRLQVRKRAVPELADYQRLATMCNKTDQSLQALAQAVGVIGQQWSTI